MNVISTFDSKAFRRALGNFATGITVVTATNAPGERVGVTANSFNSVSLEPPLILWSIDKRSNSCDVFESASHFAVNILAADQMDLSNHFAKPSDDKFLGVDYEDGLGSAAVLSDCAAVFQCENHQRLDGGDHWILIGKVVDFQDNGRAPLLYHQGSYSLVMPMSQPSVTTPDSPVCQALGERLQNHLYYLMLQAVRQYQSDYQPLQLATGLRTAEARILMSLGEGRHLSREQLAKEVNMPATDIQNAFELLLDKELITETDARYQLQSKGLDVSATLWAIAKDQQQKAFAQFTEDEIHTFKKVLLGLIDRNE